MKTIGKAILVGLLAVLAAWVFLPAFVGIFDGLEATDSYVVGSCFFLAFEIALCTALVLGKRKEKDK